MREVNREKRKVERKKEDSQEFMDRREKERDTREESKMDNMVSLMQKIALRIKGVQMRLNCFHFLSRKYTLSRIFNTEILV